MRWKLAILSLCVGLGVATPGFAQRSGSTVESRINAVGAFKVEEQKDGTMVRIGGTSVPTFSVFKLNDPPRLFVDISNSELQGDAQTVKVNNGVISQIAMLEFKDNIQSVTRVIIGFDSPAHYDVRTEGKDVVVFVDGVNRKKTATVAQNDGQAERLEARYQADLSQTQGDYVNAVAELNATRAKLDQAQKELKALEQQGKQSQGADKTRVAAEIDAKNAELARFKADVASRTQTVDRLEKSVADLTRERDALAHTAQIATAERDEALSIAKKKERESAKARQKAEALAASLEKARTDLARASESSDSIRNKLDLANNQVQEANDEVLTARSELAEAQAREAELRAQVERLKQHANGGDQAAKQELAKLETQHAALRQDLIAREDELERTRKAARDADLKLATAQKSLDARDQEIARLERQLKQAASERDAEVARANVAAQQRVVALEAALADAKVDQGSQEVAKQLKSVQAELEQARADVARLKSEKPTQVARAVAVDPTNAVRGIRLENTGERTRVVVELSRPGSFETLPWTDSRAVMILNDVELPKALEKTLANSGGQAGAVRFVSSYRDRQGRVRLEAELDGSATELVRQDGNTLVWEFAAIEQTQQHVDWGEEQTRPSDDGFTAAPPRYPSIVTDPTQVSSVPGMSRKRITIDLRGADIQNVLRLLAKEGGVNIVSGEGVSGDVTIRLRSVPLDEVFLTVLQARGLGFEKRGNVIRVAPQSVLLAEQTRRSEARAANERTRPLEVFLLPVNYAQAKDMQDQVGSLLSPRGSVRVDSRTNTLVIKDIPDNLAAVRALVESLDSQVPQVLIEARIVETNDTFTQSLGIQWGGDATWAQSNGNPTGLLFPSVLGIAGGAADPATPTAGTTSNPNFAVNLPTAVGTGSGGAIGLTMGSIGGAVNLNLRLTALESAGHAKIVSSPKILTLDNKAAAISQGTSIPVSVVSAAGVQTVFVDASIELSVTPHVTPDGNIQLEISASKNEPDFQNTGARGDPTIIRKQADTQLLIKDGDTTVIGGIYTRNSGSNIAAVPFFHKIPILGFFFRNQSESDRRTELLIFITPKIVNRAESIGQGTK